LNAHGFIFNRALYSFLALLMALGTLVDVYQQFNPVEKSDLATDAMIPNEPKVFTLLKCFSININGKKVVLSHQWDSLF